MEVADRGSRLYQGGSGKMIGFVGAKLSFIDCASVVGTHRRLFDFNPSPDPMQEPFCTVNESSIGSDMFVVFTRPGGKGNPAKPRLSHTGEWPHMKAYLATEHLLALRTQKGFDWVSKVQVIWKAMISYVKDSHPSQYPPSDEKIADKWKRFSEECKAFREDERALTYSGLERILVYALFYGYGAEPSLAAADQRMGREFPAVFVSGERMCAAVFAHPTSIAFLNGRPDPNKNISDILLDWYETLSGSPVDVCEPIFDLAVKGMLQHKEADVTKAEAGDNKIKIGDEELDVVFAPGVFGTGLDEVVKGILPSLKEQAPGIPLWQKLGQLANKDGKLVNVWDYGNNRGTGLNYEHGNNVSKVKPRMSVSVLTAAYEFAPPLTASMLAHDIFAIGGESDPSRKLQDVIKREQPSQADYDCQIPKLEEFYVEAIKRFHYLEAIATEADNNKWREYYEKGLTEDGRQSVLKTFGEGTGDQKKKAQEYQKAVEGIKREAMGYDEWYAPFNDVDVPVGWKILQEANNSYQKTRSRNYLLYADVTLHLYVNAEIL
ncbi:hypothetical protein FRC11_010147 [Ceratobasidium sp. 423]|nr:hypothetical protein FRC11_010147 [Ceratobasidium sp. 423]